MNERGDAVPPWGTPDGRPDRESADGSATPYGTPQIRPSLLTADTLVFHEHAGFLSGHRYDLLSAEGVPLGAVTTERDAVSAFFGGQSITFRLTDAGGELVASVYLSGSWGRSQFTVRDARDAEVGTVEQENAFMAPRFILTTSAGVTMRLHGGTFSSPDWQIVDARDESVVLGEIAREFAGLGGLLSGTQRFALRLSPRLLGTSRLLAMTATVCLDFVRDKKRR